MAPGSCAANHLSHVAAEHVHNLASIGVNASASVDFGGSATLLRETLWQHCFNESHNHDRKIRIGVLGGSMTDGSMNCHALAHVVCVGKNKPVARAWPAVLQTMLRDALRPFPCTVEVVPRATSASRVNLFLSEPELTRRVLPSDDLIIEDYSINDNKGIHPNDTHVRHQVQGGFELLARRTRALGMQLVHVEATAYSCSTRGGDHVSDGTTDADSAAPRENINEAVARFYGVPIVSFARATGWCQSKGANPLWLGGCGALDTPGVLCGAHPGPSTHRIYANMLAAFILHQAANVAAQRHATASGAGGSSSGCIGDDIVQQTLVDLGPSDSPPSSIATNPSAVYLPSKTLTALVGCPRPLAEINVVYTGCSGSRQALQRPARSVGWRCYEDRPGKPGWISTVASPNVSSTIEFPMRLSSGGFVVVGYLRSYEGMARATVGIDRRYGDADGAVTIDGLWHDPTSQLDYAVIPVETLLGPRKPNITLTSNPSCIARPQHCPGARVAFLVGLHLRTDRDRDDAKFKLMSLSTC